MACAVAAGIAWWRWPTSLQTTSREAVPRAVEAAVSASTPLPPPPMAVAPLVPPPKVPPGIWVPSDDVRDFTAAATAGDSDAMLRIGRALRACVESMADPEATKLQEQYKRALAGLRERDMPAGAHAAANIESLFATRLAMHADCQAIGAERVATGLAWIERAARAGHVKAKVEFARDAFSEFADRYALIENLDEVIRRRDLARAWVMQALEAGDAGAVDVLVDAYYGQSPLFPRDYRQGAPYSMAQEMIRTRRVDTDAFRRLYEHGPARESYGWGEENGWVHDAAAWQAALDRARDIVDRIPPDPARPPPG